MHIMHDVHRANFDRRTDGKYIVVPWAAKANGVTRRMIHGTSSGGDRRRFSKLENLR
jgi:hypothetical protein